MNFTSADIAILNVITSSRLANLRYFCAPSISKEAEVKIFWEVLQTSLLKILIGRTFDALYFKIPFSERQNIKHEEPPTNVIEINKSIDISEDQLRKDDDTVL
ncbi:hypothetical protein GLOIN_2v1766036 [Rhizophagus irregularis DAOM 181602=DAOM 197198]|nr:hypothetical protein GLOIN_2v1766036 [Rhizophagus irregularis DAOM 181602=DAOM 197198]